MSLDARISALFADPEHPVDLADELDAPKYAQKHPHWFVRCDGRWGVHAAGLRESPTSHYSGYGNAVTVDRKYTAWPADRWVHVKTKEDAKRIVTALIIFNAHSALRQLSY